MYPKLVKEIRSKTGELHFKRWRLLSTPWFSLYIHYIAKADEDTHSHNHPWSLRTFILSGGYLVRTEKTVNDIVYKSIITYKYKSWFSYTHIDRSEYHKVIHLDEPTWTIALVGKKYNDWGYLVDGVHIDHVEYRKRKHELQN